MSRRVNNFSAGPSTLPQQVLEEAQAEFVEYQGSGTVSYTHLTLPTTPYV